TILIAGGRVVFLVVHRADGAAALAAGRTDSTGSVFSALAAPFVDFLLHFLITVLRLFLGFAARLFGFLPVVLGSQRSVFLGHDAPRLQLRGELAQLRPEFARGFRIKRPECAPAGGLPKSACQPTARF